MTEKSKGQLSTYEVRCGDDTEGRISASSAVEAREMAEEMCQIHQGVKGEPHPRMER